MYKRASVSVHDYEWLQRREVHSEKSVLDTNRELMRLHILYVANKKNGIQLLTN